MIRSAHAALLAIALVAISAQRPAHAARDFYVSATGNARNAGTAESPWDLRTALSGARGRIEPGDTIYLLGGTYKGHFSVDVSGRADAPITFKAAAGATPTIDGYFTTTTSSAIKSGRRDDRITVSVAASDDIHVASEVVLGGGSGRDQLLIVDSVSGLKASGLRRCPADACAELPSGSNVWVLESILRIPYSVHDVWLQGLEITDSGTDSRRWATSSDDDFFNRTQRRRDGVANYGARTKIIDFVVHDTFNGIGAATQAVDSEYSGIIAFNNGVLAPDRGHGHGFYIQNQLNGIKTFRHVVSMQNFGLTAQMYASSAGVLQGNAVFDGTVWVTAAPDGSPPINQMFLLGGGSPLRNVTVRDSHFYGRPAQLGYSNPDNDGITFANNVFRSTLMLRLSKHVTVTGNTFAPRADTTLISLRFDGTDNVPGDYVFRGNSYYASNTDFPFPQFYVAPTSAANCGYFWWDAAAKGYGYCQSPQSWRETLGYDADSTYRTTPPTGATVAALADPYDPSRRLIVVHNWERSDAVSLEVSGFGWREGARYTLRNVADYFGDVVRATYDGRGSIAIPMTGHTIAKPNGYPSPLAVSTFPDFGVFVLTLEATGG